VREDSTAVLQGYLELPMGAACELTVGFRPFEAVGLAFVVLPDDLDLLAQFPSLI
jgi:hypothetical protein